MSALILHHYSTSPFAEKVRLVFGYKKLDWQSVTIPMVMPKPDLMPLTGGYRRTPVLQIGADIYCDTSLICNMLEQHQPSPSLFGPHAKGLVNSLAQWADNIVFPTAMGYNFQPAGAAHVFANTDPEVVKVFAQDRQAMRGGASRMPAADATGAYKNYLRRISSMLEGQDFLLGDQPTLADFSAYHSVWFTVVKVPNLAGILDALPAVKAWVGRMQAFGHGHMGELSAADALKVAQDATPLDVSKEVFQDEHGIALGTQVLVQAESFGTEPTQGELVAASRTRYSLRRSDPRAGTVHVHFPRNGFLLKRAEA
jgi:glutathione S-transferase